MALLVNQIPTSNHQPITERLQTITLKTHLRDETCRTLASLIEKLENYEIINSKLIEEKENLKKIKSVDRLLDSNDGRIASIPEKFRDYKQTKHNWNQVNFQNDAPISLYD